MILEFYHFILHEVKSDSDESIVQKNEGKETKALSNAKSIDFS